MLGGRRTLSVVQVLLASIFFNMLSEVDINRNPVRQNDWTHEILKDSVCAVVYLPIDQGFYVFCWIFSCQDGDDKGYKKPSNCDKDIYVENKDR